MTTTWLEQTLEKRESQGRKEGFFLGRRQLLREMIEARFGSLSEGARACLDAWPEDRLTELGFTLLTVKTLQELGLEG